MGHAQQFQTMNQQPQTNNHHLWEYRWARDLLLLAAFVILLWFAYEVRAVMLPLLLGLGGAYVINPLVSLAHKQWKLPRWISTSALMLIGVAVLAGLSLYILPKLIDQTFNLLERLPPYFDYACKRFGVDWTLFTTTAASPTDHPTDTGATLTQLTNKIDTGSAVKFISKLLGISIGVVSSAVGTAFYTAMVVAVGGFSFFFFSSYFTNIVKWFDSLIPQTNREKTLAIITRMDKSVSAFVRGRLIQSAVMALILATGWGAVGIPYWLLLGLGGGVLNLVPYAPSLAWIAALSLTWLDALSTGSDLTLVSIIVFPSAVYFLAQSFDGWVIEPIVQGKATNLDPLSVMIAVLIGGSLAGLVGLIVAIPTASCINILAQELVLPRLRNKSGTESI